MEIKKECDIRTGYKKFEYGYKGLIKIFHNKKKIYTIYSRIFRISKEDAIEDAKILKEDLLLENGFEKHKKRV
jgi:hypothetical protein